MGHQLDGLQFVFGDLRLAYGNVDEGFHDAGQSGGIELGDEQHGVGRGVLSAGNALVMAFPPPLDRRDDSALAGVQGKTAAR